MGAADMTVQTFGIFSTPEVRYLKIRSVSASYLVPESWARAIGGTSGTITLTARNVANFTNFKLGPDAELGSVYAGIAAQSRKRSRAFRCPSSSWPRSG